MVFQMRLPRGKERGFTLIEVIMSLAILSTLGSIVVPQVSGIFSYGSEQAWKIDAKNIQQTVTVFYVDGHRYDAIYGWNEASGTAGHYYPTANGQASRYDTAMLIVAANNVANPQRYFDNGANGAIWMGLLVNQPGFSDASNPEIPGGSSPVSGEYGPYLNEIPKSSSAGNGNAGSGPYTWVVAKDGKVSALYWDRGEWHQGFTGD